MRPKTVILFLAAAALLWAGGTAQGGVVRYVGKKMQAPGRVAASGVDPVPSLHAPADYRRHLVDVLVVRALRRAGARAEAAA